MFSPAIISAFVATLSLFCIAQPLEERQPNGSPFNLYAYGDGINGLPIYYADGQAQIGDMSLSNAFNKVPMYVTYSSNDQMTWIAHANTTQSTRTFTALGSSTSSATNLLCLEESSSVTNPVTFKGINSASSSNAEPETITNAWSLYGSTVLINRPGGNFYAKSTNKSGWWNLMWSTSVEAGLEATALVLRTNPPVLL